VQTESKEPSLFAKGVVPVEAVKLMRLHLLELFVAVDVRHLDQGLVGGLWLLLKVSVDLALVADVGEARLSGYHLVQAGETARRCELLMALSDIIIEELVGL